MNLVQKIMFNILFLVSFEVLGSGRGCDARTSARRLHLKKKLQERNGGGGEISVNGVIEERCERIKRCLEFPGTLPAGIERDYVIRILGSKNYRLKEKLIIIMQTEDERLRLQDPYHNQKFGLLLPRILKNLSVELSSMVQELDAR